MLRGEGERKHYGLINDFNRFICDYSLNLGKINFVVAVHTLSLEKKNNIKLKYHIKDGFKINDKQTIKMPKKDKYVKFKNFERKIKSTFTI